MSTSTAHLIQFSLLIIFTFLSLPCILFILYNYLQYRSFRRQFHNEILFLLIVWVFINILFHIPTTFSYYARGESLVRNETFCLIWQIFDYIFTSCIVWCQAFLTIERYILIFHSSYLRTRRQRQLFHYFPLIIINIYLIVFYIFTKSFIKCSAHYDYEKLVCGDDCIEEYPGLSQFNELFNIIFPILIVIFGSIILLGRILWTRREMQRNLRNWSKNWKMFIQLLGVSLMYIIVWIPITILSLISIFTSKHPSPTEHIEDYFYFGTYLCELLVPIGALVSWPELILKIRKRFRSNSIASASHNAYSIY